MRPSPGSRTPGPSRRPVHGPILGPMEELRVTTRRAWRNWLARHHADSDGVWFVYAKTGTGEPTVSYEESVLEALCFGWVDGLLKSMDETFYKRRFTPRKPRSTWSPEGPGRESPGKGGLRRPHPRAAAYLHPLDRRRQAAGHPGASHRPGAGLAGGGRGAGHALTGGGAFPPTRDGSCSRCPGAAASPRRTSSRRPGTCPRPRRCRPGVPERSAPARWRCLRGAPPRRR